MSDTIETYYGAGQYTSRPRLTRTDPCLGQQAGAVSVEEVIEALELMNERQQQKIWHNQTISEFDEICQTIDCFYCKHFGSTVIVQ